MNIMADISIVKQIVKTCLGNDYQFKLNFAPDSGKQLEMTSFS